MYKYEQKINKQIYVYEITSYWDKVKKQPRQYRKYIGKKNPDTGEIIKTSHSRQPVNSSNYGNVFFLDKIAQRLGLTDILKKAFEDIWEEILTMAFFQVSEKSALYLCEYWLGVTHNIYQTELSSQKISELLDLIGHRFDDILEFSKEWIKQLDNKEYLFFDLTSFSSYSKNISITEWGHNRDKEKLPQINFGLVYGLKSNLPVFYNTYPGSINDVLTINNLLKYCDYLDLKNITLILDKGFYSQYNLNEFSKNQTNFIISAPFTSKSIENLINKHEKNLNLLKNSFKLKNKIMYGIKDTAQIGDEIYHAYIYLDEKRKVDEVENFISLLIEYEEKVKEKKILKKEILEDFLNNNFAQWKRYFKIINENEYCILERIEENINETISRKGKIVILSNKELPISDILNLYREKDKIEKCYDNIKNELDGKRIKIHNDYTLKGKLFLNFISVILYSEIDRIMKDKKLYKNDSIQTILQELKKIDYIKFNNDKYILTEISKKQKDIFKAFDIDLPT